MEQFPPALLWNLILTILVAPLGWFVKSAIDRVNEMERLHAHTREEVARNYVTKQDLQTDLSRLFDRFDRLEQKLDRVIQGK